MHTYTYITAQHQTIQVTIYETRARNALKCRKMRKSVIWLPDAFQHVQSLSWFFQGQIVNKSGNIINYIIICQCKYSKPIGQFLVTWPSVMLHTDSKYHIDRSIFSHINIDCHHIVLLLRHIVMVLHIVLLLRHIVPLFDKNITLVLPWYLMSQ